jgi:hypothetical protein
VKLGSDIFPLTKLTAKMTLMAIRTLLALAALGDATIDIERPK